jgi:hypothetical protein
MSWYIENVVIGPDTETAIIINGNRITDTFTLSQNGTHIIMTLKQIFELCQLVEDKIVNF